MYPVTFWGGGGVGEREAGGVGISFPAGVVGVLSCVCVSCANSICARNKHQEVDRYQTDYGQQGEVSCSVHKYVIIRSPYDNELVTPLTVRNVYITLRVPARLRFISTQRSHTQLGSRNRGFIKRNF